MTPDEKIKQLDSMGYYALKGEQLEKYKELRKEELEATRKLHEYLNSLLPSPLSVEERDQLCNLKLDDFVYANTGDGMDEDRVIDEVEDMCDWEFVMHFGRLDAKLDGGRAKIAQLEQELAKLEAMVKEKGN